MKKFLLFAGLLLFVSFTARSQYITTFTEDFELPSMGDSVVSSQFGIAGTDDWGGNTRVHSGSTSLRCDSCQVKTGKTTYLTSIAFSTVGNSYVLLTFSQICKVDPLDGGIIEVSSNGGTSWTQLSGLNYVNNANLLPPGVGTFVNNGNKFTNSSYGGTWNPASPTALPLNAWWKQETFDVSLLIGNCANAKVRFKLPDGGIAGPNGNKGWYLDNIRVKMSYSEQIPPFVALANPIWKDVTYTAGPYPVRAKVSDLSGLSAVKLVYKVDGGTNDTLSMTFQASDTSYYANLPLLADSSQVCYWVIAYDASPAHNFNTTLNSGPAVCLIYFQPFHFPFNDNFEGVNNLWTSNTINVNTPSTDWQLGTPSFNATNSAHSPTKSWDVNLATAYDINANCELISPPFNFTGAFNARMSFWFNCKTQATSDGFRLLYSTNGTSWTILGAGPTDPQGINWYTTNNLDFTNLPAWEGNSNGWKQAKYRLSVLNNQTNTVRFKFVFLSNGWTNVDGVSIDDFSIVLPAPQEAAADALTAPITGCGLQNEIVKMKIINMGLTAISTITASYKRSASTTVVNELVTFSPPLAPGDTTLYTFTTPVNLATIVPVDSSFTIKAWVSLTNDPNHGDDTTYRTVISKYVPYPPGVVTQSIGYGTSTTLTATSTLPISWWKIPVGGTIADSLHGGSTYPTTNLYGDTVFYVQVRATNGCTSPRSSSIVHVSSPPSHDGAVLTVDAPVTGFNLQLPPDDSVKITVRNYGLLAMSNFTLKYRITGPLPTQNYTAPVYTGSIGYGNQITFTYSQIANLSAFGTYTIKAWIELPGDLNHANDTATQAVTNKMYIYCLSGSTEVLNATNLTMDDNIGNVTFMNMNNGNANPTNNNSTALNNYTNFTNVVPAQVTRDQTYSISVSTIYGGTPYGTGAKVYIDWNWDGQFDEATEACCFMDFPTGGPFTNSGNVYVPVNAHIGLTRLRVVLKEGGTNASITACGTFNYGETEDYLVYINPQLRKDVGVIAIVLPPKAYPEFTSSPVKVTLKNFGLDTIHTMNVTYKIDNNAPVTQTYNGTLPPISNNTQDFNFTPNIILPSGYHTFCAWTTMTTLDSNAFNDTTCKDVYGIPISPLPYVDDFEGTSMFVASNSAGTKWIHGIPSATAFPNDAHSPTHVWGTNLLAAPYSNSANCSLTTQLFAFNGAVNAKLSFWMKRKIESGATNGDGCILDYSIDNGNSWLVLGLLNDPLGINWYNGTINATTPSSAAWSGNALNWLKVSYKLSIFNAPFVGKVRFRFRFVSNFGTTDAGVFIDDFQIFNPYHTDAGIDSIKNPNGEDAAGFPGHVVVRFNNFSMTPMTTCPVSYKVGNSAPVTETWSGNLAAGDSTTYVFTTPYTIPLGSYCLKAYTSLPNDSASINDTAYKCAFGIPVFSIPYKDNFDSAVNYWYTKGGPNGPAQWEKGAPINSTINAPYSAPNCWKTKINGMYASVAHPDVLYSPMFNLAFGYDSIAFYHWVDTYSGDKSRVEYLAINPSTGIKEWKILGSMGDPNSINWYNNGSSGFVGDGGVPGWHRSAYDLKILPDIASPAQFRYYFYCYYANTHATPFAGWAIDNFELTTPKIPQDAGVISIIQPGSSVTYGTNLDVKIRIKNFGTDTLTSIPIKYQINGTTVAAATWSGSLLPDATVDYTFPAIASPLQSFSLCAFTDLPFDTKLDNDTSCKLVSVIAPPFDVAITQIIEPVTMTIHGEQSTVKVRITNLGYTPVSSIPIEYRVGLTPIVVDTTWTGTALNQNDFIDFTFDQKYSYEYIGFYYICVLTKLPNDGYGINDTLCAKIENKWTSIPENPSNGLFMAQSYPNPCDQSTEIEYRVPGAGEVTFNLCNYLGQRLLIKSEKVTQGDHKLIIDTSKLPQGLYYYYIEYEGNRMIQKMVVTH